MIASLLSLAACGDDGGGGGSALCEGGALGTDHTFVVSSAALPANANQATQLALDINGDGRNDNQLGGTLASLAGPAGLDLAGTVNEAIASGNILLLLNLKAEELSRASCAGVNVYLGTNPSPAPCTDPEDPSTCGQHLDGNGSFEVASSAPRDQAIIGDIVNGRFALGPNHEPGEMTVELALFEGVEPLSLHLYGARIQIDSVSETGLTGGLLGGAIKNDDLQTSILPSVHGLMTTVIAEDCPGRTAEGDPCCEEDSTGELILGIFDTDDNCEVSLEEITTSPVVAGALTPDIDFFDDSGAFNPNVDGVKDSLSLGMGFDATTGTFTIP